MFFYRCNLEGKMSQPTPEKIYHARNSIGLTIDQAAKLVYSTKRAWEYWESGERSMSHAIWELFLMKISNFVPRKYTEQPRKIVVILADDGIEFIDVVADDNFLSLENCEHSDRKIICSMAVDKSSGRPYVRRVEFLNSVNVHVLNAVKAWSAIDK